MACSVGVGVCSVKCVVSNTPHFTLQTPTPIF